MGAGLFTVRGAIIAYAEPYSDLYDMMGGFQERDRPRWTQAFRDLEDAIRLAVGPSFDEVDEWHRPGLRTIARNGLYDVGLHEDDYGRVHIAVLTSGRIQGEPHENFAKAGLRRAADRIFDAIEKTYPLRVRKTAWTSRPRTGSEAAA